MEILFEVQTSFIRTLGFWQGFDLIWARKKACSFVQAGCRLGLKPSFHASRDFSTRLTHKYTQTDTHTHTHTHARVRARPVSTLRVGRCLRSARNDIYIQNFLLIRTSRIPVLKLSATLRNPPPEVCACVMLVMVKLGPAGGCPQIRKGAVRLQAWYACTTHTAGLQHGLKQRTLLEPWTAVMKGQCSGTRAAAYRYRPISVDISATTAAGPHAARYLAQQVRRSVGRYALQLQNTG
eukprot:842922-Pelagomonas_calceolata.AAC.3